jgi:hypothetical protein
MRWRIAAVVMGVLLTGCGGSTTSASDCVTLVRQNGTTFREIAVTGHEATRAGQADRSDCDDMGVEARGAYFPADPDQVNVWTFDGFDPSDVIGVRHSDGKVGVFVAETMSEVEVDDVSDALSGGGGAGGGSSGSGGADPVRALPDGGAASCIEQYTPQAVGHRAFAFDGNVTSIGAAEGTDANDLGYVPVTFAINEWFHGADTATFTVDMASPEVTSQETSVSGGSYAVGSRLLVSGEQRWGGAAPDDAVAWGCGFTRYFDQQTAEHWRASAH